MAGLLLGAGDGQHPPAGVARRPVDGLDRLDDRGVAGPAGVPEADGQVGRPDEHPVHAGDREDLRGGRDPGRVLDHDDHEGALGGPAQVLLRARQPVAARAAVGGEAALAQRRVVRRGDRRRGLLGGPHVRHDDPGGPEVQGPQGLGGVPAADADEHVEADPVGGGQMVLQLQLVGRAVLGVEHDVVEPRVAEQLDQPRVRHPDDPADEPLPRLQPGPQRRHRATIPADRSMSAAHRPGIPSIATTAAPTSSSVTIRPSAARETYARSASA